jgi:hypothetical protein
MLPAFARPATGFFRQVATVVVDTAVRPQGCFRMRWEVLQEGVELVQHGKTGGPHKGEFLLTARVASI